MNWNRWLLDFMHVEYNDSFGAGQTHGFFILPVHKWLFRCACDVCIHLVYLVGAPQYGKGGNFLLFHQEHPGHTDGMMMNIFTSR